ncbi:Oligopeptide transport system permease protein oppB [Actinomyces howellii]|uniref:Oligopeptide transport system permease protein oppB n=2 Tax=Actinomyces howellii TaxID=52771 RepID=A0A448HJR1_9ACTO|nr:Oligopeptide transport system permease protein oppB [Actinomyces howellii]
MERGRAVIRYMARRALGWLGMIFLATNLTYFLASFYLNPRSNYVARRPKLPESQIDQMLAQYNLNDKDPILERWWTWLTGVLTRWDWGSSPTGGSVNDEIAFRVWVSAELVLGASILMTLLGVGLGVYTASRQYRRADRVWQGISIIAMNIHIVVAAMIVVMAGIWFNQRMGSTVLFVTGAQSVGVEGIGPRLLDAARHLVLPTIALVMTGYAGTHFMQRSLLLDNINADYVRTARAKGLTRSQAIRKHALRTSIIPVATSVAFTIPTLFTGAVMTETIFGWEGMGRYFVETISKNDINGAVAVAAFGAAMTALGAILADMVVVALDPRVRVS